MEKMTGEDLETMFIDTKASVSGLGQWKPVGFKMLSDIASES